MESRTEVKRDRFEIESLEELIAPVIVLVSSGGNTPHSNSAHNGVAIENQIPAGHATPGQN
jgi:hypothetical protein